MKTKNLAQELEPVAKDILVAFDAIAAAALRDLQFASQASTDVFANTSNSTFTNAPLAAARITDGNRQLVAESERLRSEPAIARVVYDDGERECVSYVCRATPPTLSDLDLISQRAPRGRLAALPIGEAMTTPNGKTLTVLQRVEVHPERIGSGWDSKNNIFRLAGRRSLTVESLVQLLGIPQAEAQDLLSQILADERDKDLVREGQKKAILTSMELRDQAILDAEQDEIFRLPIDEQIFLMGPPGTGKTTTLIRRLGQKLDYQHLTEDERRLVDAAGSSASGSHADSWILFTPTELLRQYVKEAFNRERIPASDLHIRTWEEFRRDTARNTFRILRSAVRRGFVLHQDVNTLDPTLTKAQRDFFQDFNDWQSQQVFDSVRVSAEALSVVSDSTLADVGKMVVAACVRDTTSVVELILAIERRLEVVRAAVDDLRKAVNAPIDGALNQRLNRDRNFAQDLATAIQQSSTADDTEIEELAEEDDEEEDEIVTGAMLGVTAYRAALRALARSQGGGRRILPGTRNALVLDRVGREDLTPKQLQEIAESLRTLAHARSLLTVVKRYVFDAPRRYRSFRRLRTREAKWFAADHELKNNISEVELDAVLLASLKAARELLSRSEIRSNIQSRSWSLLEPILGLYKNQVLADESTDFSVLQLACMANLTHPSISSFFASGDFNQRLTQIGISTLDDVRWVIPNAKFKQLSVLFRQSKRLQKLSDKLLRIFEPAHGSAGVPSEISGSEVSPVLLEGHSDLNKLAGWLASRAREIERSLGQMPSLAIFVPTEANVEALTDALNAQFRDDSLQAVACVKGQIKGQDTDLRVFDVRHVKGLEFEAAFFTSVDVLAREMPDEFARYLYVGATRAATYLGVSCESRLPAEMSSLRDEFTLQWFQQS
jgi:GTPase SAR1 family protein